MIHPYNNETQTKWDRGEFPVQLSQPGNPMPLGYCDGTDADRQELEQIAEAEGADDFFIEVKTLKTGREIWILA